MSRPTGRPACEETLYARELGIDRHKLYRLGGKAWLEAMTPDARKLILADKPRGDSKTLMGGGLKARRMPSRKAAWLIRPHVEFDQACGDLALLMGGE